MHHCLTLARQLKRLSQIAYERELRQQMTAFKEAFSRQASTGASAAQIAAAMHVFEQAITAPLLRYQQQEPLQLVREALAMQRLTMAELPPEVRDVLAGR